MSRLSVRLHHASGCPTRIERSDPRTATGDTVPVIRCLDCGSFEVVGPVERPMTPGSREWVDAWLHDPHRLARTLTPAERLDPRRNPCHPFADSWPPGHEPKIGAER